MNLYSYYILLTFLLFNFQSISSEKFRGVTVEVGPYVYVRNNEYQGYCVDVLNEISKIAGFNFSLYSVKKHGSVSPYGEVDGMIGEIYNKGADFAIGDLTVTEGRKRVLQFTEPIMRLSVSALIHTTNARYIQTFRDLSKQSRIDYGVIKSSKILEMFYDSDNPDLKKMYNTMMKTQTLVANVSQGIRLAKISKYAFIQESAANEFIAANDCDLTSIRDYNDYFKREYAIGLPLDSPHLFRFNNAIKKLESEGVFDRLKAKHWKTYCNSSQTLFNTQSLNYILVFILITRFLY